MGKDDQTLTNLPPNRLRGPFSISHQFSFIEMPAEQYKMQMQTNCNLNHHSTNNNTSFSFTFSSISPPVCIAVCHHLFLSVCGMGGGGESPCSSGSTTGSCLPGSPLLSPFPFCATAVPASFPSSLPSTSPPRGFHSYLSWTGSSSPNMTLTAVRLQPQPYQSLFDGLIATCTSTGLPPYHLQAAAAAAEASQICQVLAPPTPPTP